MHTKFAKEAKKKQHIHVLIENTTGTEISNAFDLWIEARLFTLYSLHFVRFYCTTPLFLATLRTQIKRAAVMNPVIYVTLSIKQPYNISIRPIPMVSLRIFFFQFSVIVYEFKEIISSVFGVYVSGWSRFDENDSIQFSPFDQNHFDLMYTLNNWPHRK